MPANAGAAETGAQCLGREDALEEGITTHSSIFAWEIPWTEEPGRLRCMGPQSGATDWDTTRHTCTQARTLMGPFWETAGVKSLGQGDSWVLVVCGTL